MENFSPLVSIIIPVYNGSNYLSEAIDSALAQEYKNVEIIVVNDGSTDAGQTEQIAHSYGERIRYFLKPNGGVATALNLGIEQMRGDYFSWLSHDDKYTPQKIGSQIKLLSAAPYKLSVVFSGFAIIDENSKEIHRVLPSEKYDARQLCIPLFALLHGQINGCSLLIHRSHFERVGMFDEKLLTTQDFDLWFRIMRNTQIIFCPEILSLIRVHKKQGSQTSLKAHSQACDTLWINMMESLSNEEMISIDGSIYSFYKNVYVTLLVYSTNRCAALYAKHRAYQELKGANNFFSYMLKSTNLFFLGYVFLAHELVVSIRKNGVLISAKRVAYAAKRLFHK